MITSPSYGYRGVGGVSYGPSKTALNSVTVVFAQELDDTRIKTLGLGKTNVPSESGKVEVAIYPVGVSATSSQNRPSSGR